MDRDDELLRRGVRELTARMWAARARGAAVLARWLGPWADDQVAAGGVSRRTVRVPAEPGPGRASAERQTCAPGFDAWVYRPSVREPYGWYLLAPGLHYAGPADPRLDRFCRALAASGLLVFAPFLPDYTRLRVAASALADFERAFDAMLALPDAPRGVAPGLFSISFGSLLALGLAANPRRASQVGAVVTFGGYADFADAVRFCLCGPADAQGPPVAYDPLNRPVVFLNLIEEIPGAPGDPAALCRAWRRYVEATWGRPELKPRARHEPFARALAAELPEDERELFLIGCGVLPGAWERCRDALARRLAAEPFLDPRPALPGVMCPVHIVHGVADDVIPAAHARALAASLPPGARVYLTGFYEHTRHVARTGSGAGGMSAVMRRLQRGLVAPAMARELATMASILVAIATAGSRPSA